MYLTENRTYEPAVEEIIADFQINITETSIIELKNNAIKNWAYFRENYQLANDIRESLYIPHWREVQEKTLFRWMTNFIRHERSNYDRIIWRLIHYPSRWEVSEELKARCNRHLIFWMQTH